MIQVPIKLLHERAKIPQYKTAGAACMDLHVIVEDQYGNNYTYLSPGQTKIFKTGLAMAIPEGYELQIRSRSGLASLGIHMANGVGTIDSDYRGELGVILTNCSPDILKVMDGDRVGQCKIEEVKPFEFVEVTELDSTERGEGGYGSTGSN